MAYLANPHQQRLAFPNDSATPPLFQGGTPPPSSSGEGGGVAGGSTQGSAQGAPSKGGGFASWGNLLDANKGNTGSMLGGLTSGVESQGQATREGISKATGEVTSAAQAGTLHYSGPDTPDMPGTGGRANVGSNYLTVPYSQGGSYSYQGPTGYSQGTLDTLNDQAKKTQADADALASFSGRQAALQKQAGANYNSNWGALDSAILGNSAQGEFDALKAKWGGLGGEVKAGAAAATAAADKAKEDTATAAARYRLEQAEKERRALKAWEDWGNGGAQPGPIVPGGVTNPISIGPIDLGPIRLGGF